MPKLPRDLPGHELVKLLSKFGFKPKRQKGSHIILVRGSGADKAGCVVPLHDSLKLGTLKGILKQAKISEEDFLKLL